MKPISFDHYFLYDEVTDILRQLEAEYPQLMRLSGICTTPEGREVWAVEITDLSTGDFLSKPAYYLDGNHHAGEVTGSMVAMNTIIRLLTEFGSNESITDLLKTATVYVIPRISPDGAETYMASFEKLRSVNRPYPFPEREPGLHPKDMDGDGVIRMMRIPSPYGTWKASKDDPRILTKRQPDDKEDTFYLVFPEGDIEGYDGMHIQVAPNKWGLDFNRNYPLGWFPEVRQPGAGVYPLSNPETRAVADFVLSHPNIGSADTMHTTGGILVYPPGTKPEKQGNPRDMKMFHEIGAMGTQETGYVCLNIFDEFLADADNYSSGAFDDWMYQSQGIPAYTVELWDLKIRAGVKGVWPRNKAHALTDAEKEEEYRLMVKWIDENAGDGGFKPWTSYQHPQLGEVEIGGFDFKFTVQNCPPAFLRQEVDKAVRYCLRHAAVLPRLSIDSFAAVKQSDGIYQVTATVTNKGYLPTFICEEAKSLKVDRPLVASLSGADAFILGEDSMPIGHLEGYSGVNSEYAYDGIVTGKHEPCSKKLKWVVRAAAGERLTLSVANAKAGQVTAELTLD